MVYGVQCTVHSIWCTVYSAQYLCDDGVGVKSAASRAGGDKACDGSGVDLHGSLLPAAGLLVAVDSGLRQAVRAGRKIGAAPGNGRPEARNGAARNRDPLTGSFVQILVSMCAGSYVVVDGDDSSGGVDIAVLASHLKALEVGRGKH